MGTENASNLKFSPFLLPINCDQDCIWFPEYLSVARAEQKKKSHWNYDHCLYQADYCRPFNAKELWPILCKILITLCKIFRINHDLSSSYTNHWSIKTFTNAICWLRICTTTLALLGKCKASGKMIGCVLWRGWVTVLFQQLKTVIEAKAEKVQDENNELLAQNLNRRRQQLFKQEMGSRLKSKINALLQ